MAAPRRQCLGRFYQGSLMAGFQVTTNGRFWVTAEGVRGNGGRRSTGAWRLLGFDALLHCSIIPSSLQSLRFRCSDKKSANGVCRTVPLELVGNQKEIMKKGVSPYFASDLKHQTGKLDDSHFMPFY
jgi:hypothetical protein